MLEFGSDFHFPTIKFDDKIELSANANYYAIGRHAVNALLLYKKEEWQRIWLPEYFCYDVVNSIASTGIQIKFYPDYPENDDEKSISNIKFEKGDVLFRINYFGLRKRRNNEKIQVPVIEDHSHDLLSDWALNSNASYCIASLRKTLPIPEGGILWSPKKEKLPQQIVSNKDNEIIFYKRLSAMLLKKMYIENKNIEKDSFRKLFIETEEAFNNLQISGIPEICYSMINNIDVRDWYNQKNKNWIELSDIKDKRFEILQTEDINNCNPVSLILKFQTKNDREKIKKLLIDNNIYPAILWSIPNPQTTSIINIGDTILSIHCDGRYTSEQILQLKNKIKEILKAN